MLDCTQLLIRFWVARFVDREYHALTGHHHFQIALSSSVALRCIVLTTRFQVRVPNLMVRMMRIPKSPESQFVKKVWSLSKNDKQKLADVIRLPNHDSVQVALCRDGVR